MRPGRTVARQLQRQFRFFVIAIAFIAVIAILIWSTQVNPSRPARPVNITTNDWHPYVGEDLPDDGPMAELLRLVLDYQGIDANIQYTTWDLALGNVQTGQALAAFPMVRSPERGAEFVSSDALHTFTYSLFHDTSRPTPNVDSPEKLSELRIARISGYYYWPELNDAVDEFIDFPNSAEAFTALAEGTVDLVAEGKEAGLAQMLEPTFPYDVNRFAVIEDDHPWTSADRGLHIFLRPGRDSERFLETFNANLAAVRDTTEYRNIIARLDPTRANYTVRAEAVNGGPAVLVTDSGGEDEILLPRGTQVTVLNWPQTPESPGATVKVTSGPHQGRVGTIRIDDLEIQ